MHYSFACFQIDVLPWHNKAKYLSPPKTRVLKPTRTWLTIWPMKPITAPTCLINRPNIFIPCGKIQVAQSSYTAQCLCNCILLLTTIVLLHFCLHPLIRRYFPTFNLNRYTHRNTAPLTYRKNNYILKSSLSGTKHQN